jgi:hypothetical protein
VAITPSAAQHKSRGGGSNPVDRTLTYGNLVRFKQEINDEPNPNYRPGLWRVLGNVQGGVVTFDTFEQELLAVDDEALYSGLKDEFNRIRVPVGYLGLELDIAANDAEFQQVDAAIYETGATVRAKRWYGYAQGNFYYSSSHSTVIEVHEGFVKVQNGSNTEWLPAHALELIAPAPSQPAQPRGAGDRASDAVRRGVGGLINRIRGGGQ